MAGSPGELPPHLVEGIRLFHAGRYLLAHETLEEYWIDAPAPERDFYQGLIQLSTGFHHLSRGQVVGAKLQFGKARRRLERYPAEYCCVDVAGVRAFLDAAGDRVDRGEVLTPPTLDAAAGAPGHVRSEPAGA
jgi:predicted metal-dependent hydrolase